MFDRVDWIPWLGPGLVMAATAIGASHLVLAPTAGAAYGYALLWVVTLSHVYKYPAFEFGPRYAVATGSSLLEGYARIPGPRRWAVWLFLTGTVVQGVSVLAGVLSVAAVVAHAIAPDVSLIAWSGVIGAIGIALLASGRFSGLSAISKLLLGGVAIMTTLAFFARTPDPEILPALIRPALPAGSVVLVAALLGWMPTGLDVSVWHSMWALERREAWARRAGTSTSQNRRVLGTARLDLGLGYGLSFFLGIAFLSLGVAVLAPLGAVPSGAEVAVTIARLYTDVLGSWAFYPFLVAALFGMVSTTFGVMDGFPRAFDGCLGQLFDRGPSERVYWGFLGTITALAVIEIAFLPNPVALVTIAAIASFVLAPFTYAFNTYCVTRLIDDPALRPSVALRLWAYVGIACAAASAALFLWLQS